MCFSTWPKVPPPTPSRAPYRTSTSGSIVWKECNVLWPVKTPILTVLKLPWTSTITRFGTFGNNCNSAVDWAVGVLAGVDLIYRNELNDLITLQATYVNVWETPEPWANIADNAGSMLESFRTTWLTDSDLSTQQRDFVHLMTRRGDTGTGGIAYLDGICNSYGYGFSAGMSAASDFIPLPSYSWNLDVVAHELGHNFGSNHTHWCGWNGSADHPSGTAGGAIDGCYGAEGSCSDGPSVSSGTIMSYCHLNVGKTLEFHPIVEQQAFFQA